jgi:hypothetical protein
MVVKIRLNYAPAFKRSVAWNRQAALVASSLMTPIAVMAWALGFWRIAADLGWTGAFAIASGFFSHWQVWIAIGIVMQFVALLLHRLTRGENYDDKPPVVS